MTRIPELEQELVAAAARLKGPRRLVRRALRVALAAAAVTVVVALAVVVAADNDGDRRAQPVGAVPSPPNPNDDSTTETTLSQEQKIERTGNNWARLFAAGGATCRYMIQPACEREDCVRVGAPPRKIRHCTRPSSALRNSFRGATVEDVVIKGGYRAAAKFSNGETVELFGDGGRWLISKFGGHAGRGFFN